MWRASLGPERKSLLCFPLSKRPRAFNALRKEVKMIRVLLVEDDPAVSEIICRYLQETEEYTVTAVPDAESARELAETDCDVILMDVMLPDGSGIRLCEELRTKQKCPLLFISCIDDDSVITDALAHGGDDYIVKPFSNAILDARIKANLRRVRMDQETKPRGPLTCGSLRLDEKKMTVTLRGEEKRLGNMEMRILSFFMQHPGEYYTSAELYRKIWGKPSLGDTRTVLVHIYNLRRKLESNPASPVILRNIPGKGYVFDPSEIN